MFYVGENMGTRKCAIFFVSKFSAENAVKALKDFVPKLGINTQSSPRFVSDRGSELRSVKFQTALKELNFESYHPNSLNPAHVAPVERLIRK